MVPYQEALYKVIWAPIHTRWAPTSYKWSYNPYKWPYKWVTGVITPISEVITLLITGRGPTLYPLYEVYMGFIIRGIYHPKGFPHHFPYIYILYISIYSGLQKNPQIRTGWSQERWPAWGLRACLRDPMFGREGPLGTWKRVTFLFQDDEY